MAAIDEGVFQNILSVPTGSGGFFVSSVWSKLNLTTFQNDYWIQVSRFDTSNGDETHIYTQACTLNGTIGPEPLIIIKGMARIDDSIYLSIHERTDYDTGPLVHYSDTYIRKISVTGTVEATYVIGGSVNIGTDTTEINYSIHEGTDYVGGDVVDRIFVCTYPANITSGDSAQLVVLTPALALTTASSALGSTYNTNPRTLQSSTVDHGITAYHEAPEGNGIRYVYYMGSGGAPDWRAVQGTAGFTELSTTYSSDNRPTIDKRRGWIISANVGGGLAHAWDAVTGDQIMDGASPVEFGSNSGAGRYGVRVTSSTDASMFYTGEDFSGDVRRYDGTALVWSADVTRGSGVPSGASMLDKFWCHSIVPTGD